MNLKIDYKPNIKQAQAHWAAENYRNVLYGGAVGGGKSYWLCISAIHHALKYPGARVCLVRKHLSTFKNSTLVTLLGLIPEELKNPNIGWSHNQQDGKIILPNKSAIIYGGVGTPEEVQKIGSTEFSLIGIDEAGEVDLEPFLFLSSRLRWILPNGTTPHYNILLASNPAHNWLKEYFIDSPRENFIFIQALPKDNIENLPADYIDNLRKIYPQEWVDKYLDGDWNALSGESVVIPYDYIKAAVNRDITLVDKPIIGVDPAGTGGDETAIVFAKGNTILDINCNRNSDPMISCGRIARLYNKKHCLSGMIETDGMGEVFLSRLREMGLKLRGFKSGSKSSHPDQYYNLKTEAWFYARDQFEEGLVSIPDDARLINQLSSCKYEVRDSGGKLKIESKKDMKQKMGGSPDRADAVIVALWCSRFQRDPKRDFARRVVQKATRNNSYGWKY